MVSFILHNFNNAMSSFECRTSLKYTNIKPYFKKDDKTEKSNNRLINIVPNFRKIYAPFMQNQICTYFGKGFNAQHYLMEKIRKWRRSQKHRRSCRCPSH